VGDGEDEELDVAEADGEGTAAAGPSWQ
jgi:hypothetical protein